MHTEQSDRLSRRTFLGLVSGIPIALAACGRDHQAVAAPAGDPIQPLRKSLEEWRRLLTDAEYRVLFEEDTERPFSSPLNDEYREGTYVCAACFLPLFTSDTKYDSGTGWPSFTQPIAGRIGTKLDRKLVITRSEYHCIRCGGHQGHVFEDGPPPRGERWCNNGLALRFVPAGESLPELRQ